MIPEGVPVSLARYPADDRLLEDVSETEENVGVGDRKAVQTKADALLVVFAGIIIQSLLLAVALGLVAAGV